MESEMIKNTIIAFNTAHEEMSNVQLKFKSDQNICPTFQVVLDTSDDMFLDDAYKEEDTPINLSEAFYVLVDRFFKEIFPTLKIRWNNTKTTGWFVEEN